jgi:FixJ family two-component response regulator
MTAYEIVLIVAIGLNRYPQLGDADRRSTTAHAIVDDPESTDEGISSLIRSAGYRTAVFESAESFLQYVHGCEVHCLVLDIDVPGSGSLELQRQLAQVNVSIPIIFVTTQADVLRERGLTTGAGAILGKPFAGGSPPHPSI